MLTKLPISLSSPLDGAAAVIRTPGWRSSKSPTFTASSLQAAAPKAEDASNSDTFFSIWKEAGDIQRKALEGTSTKKAVSLGKTTGEGYEATVSNLMERAENLGFPSKLVLARRGNEGESVGIGPLTKAFVMKRYEQKYDIAIGSIVTNSKGAEMSPAMLDKVTNSLKAGKQAAVVVTGAYHGHSSTVILGLEPKTNTLHAVSVDSVQVEATKRRHTIALQPILEAQQAKLEYKPAARDVSQKDAASCVTISCILARDILLGESPSFPIEFQEGQQAPVATLRTAQRSTYLENNNYDPELVYNTKTNRTLGEHRADHTVSVDGQPQNDYLKAKTLQYAEAALNWLESLPGNEIRDILALQLLQEAYPNNGVADSLKKDRT